MKKPMNYWEYESKSTKYERKSYMDKIVLPTITWKMEKKKEAITKRFTKTIHPKNFDYQQNQSFSPNKISWQEAVLHKQ